MLEISWLRALAAVPLVVVYVEGVVLMTRRQMKGAALLLLGVMAVVALVWLVAKMRKPAPPQPDAASANPPQPPAEPPGGSPLPIDQAVANVLERAAARPDDVRTRDDLYAEAVRVTAEIGTVSMPAIQRRLGVDFERASELVARMESHGLVTAPNANKQRKVLPAAEEFLARREGAAGA